jgi:hypothetical protein
VSQKKQFEFRLKKEQSQSQHWQSEFQRLREEFVSRDSEILKTLRRELALKSQKVVELETELEIRLAQDLAKEKGSVQERVKALEWDLQ